MEKVSRIISAIGVCNASCELRDDFDGGGDDCLPSLLFSLLLGRPKFFLSSYCCQLGFRQSTAP